MEPMTGEYAVPRVTLEQWRAFQAVVEFGGYAQAAEKIHKTQSTISYAVQKLEQSLGVKVLEVKGRKAHLTREGEVLLRRSRQLLDSAAAIERIADSLCRGVEARLDLSVDVVFPYRELLCVLAQFSEQYPSTRIELVESVLSGGYDLMLTGQLDLLVTTVVPPGFVGEPLMKLEFPCVASPSHPLNNLGRKATLEDLKQHRQIVTRDSGPQRRFSAPWLEAEQRWTVSNLSTAIKAIREGLGFAWVPRMQVEEDVQERRLSFVEMEEGSVRYGYLYLVYRDKDAAGPAACFLAQTIVDSCAQLSSSIEPLQ